MPRLTLEAIQASQDRIKSFHKVHLGKSLDDRAEAITVVLDHLGLPSDVKRELIDVFDSIGLTPYGYGQALLGALVVLFAYDALFDD
jgi:hypothetical protein